MEEKMCPVCGGRLRATEGVWNDIMACLNCNYDETMTHREIRKLKERRGK